MEQPQFEQMKNIPRVKPNPAQSMPAKPPEQHGKTRRVFGFILLAIILTNIALYTAGIIIYDQKTPYLAGETANLSINTSERVLWGIFYATGRGRIEYVDDPPEDFRYAKWAVLGRELISGPPRFIGKNKKDLTREYGRMNVNIRVPDVQVTQTTSLRVQVVTSGYVARKVSDYQYDLDLVEMRSVPITVVVVPDHLEWFVHQDDYVPLSIMGIFFVFGVLLKKKK